MPRYRLGQRLKKIKHIQWIVIMFDEMVPTDPYDVQTSDAP